MGYIRAYIFVTFHDMAYVLVFLGIFGDEGTYLLVGLVVSAVGNVMQRIGELLLL